MSLGHPYYLLLLLVCLPLLWLLVRRGKSQRKRFSEYAEAHLQGIYYAQFSPFWTGFKLVLAILALACLVLALVRPQWDYENRTLESSGMDIVFAIDVSKSMDAMDMMPSRLLRASMQISAFLQQLRTDRIGIIAFAGVASLQCPLTDDYEAVRIVLNSLNSDTAQRPGTNIGSALSLAEKAFATASSTTALVLISDGEDLEGQGIKQAKRLKEKGIRIYCMGVGSPQGAIVTNPDTGDEIVSKLDEQTLQQIAEQSGGEYYRVTPGGDEIQLILKRIYATEESRSRSKSLNALKDQYYLFAALALALLLVESVIDPRRRKSGLLAAEKDHAVY